MPVRYDPETETYRAQFDSASVDASLAVIEAMAAIRGCDPADLEPLYRAVDPEALDRICAAQGLGRHSGDTRIEFTYLEHEVVVKSLGLIEIRPLEDE